MKNDTYLRSFNWNVNHARNWFEKYVNGSKWILNNLDENISGVYKILFNGKVAYIGEGVNVAIRLLQHGYYIAEYTEYNWGVYLKQIEDGTIKITMEYIEIEILDETERKEKEKMYIGKYGSLLQRHKRADGNPSDICTDTKGKRVEYIQSALNLN